ncbi:MAG: hypothetical protein WAU45_11870 [Blastocatellia bacterium]
MTSSVFGARILQTLRDAPALIPELIATTEKGLVCPVRQTAGLVRGGSI